MNIEDISNFSSNVTLQSFIKNEHLSQISCKDPNISKFESKNSSFASKFASQKGRIDQQNSISFPQKSRILQRIHHNNQKQRKIANNIVERGLGLASIPQSNFKANTQIIPKTKAKNKSKSKSKSKIPRIKPKVGKSEGRKVNPAKISKKKSVEKVNSKKKPCRKTSALKPPKNITTERRKVSIF